MAEDTSDGMAEQLAQANIRIIPYVCWRLISEPLFLPAARVLMTTSRKYICCDDRLCGREVRFGRVRNCVEATM